MKTSLAFLCAFMGISAVGCHSELESESNKQLGGEPALWTPLASVGVDPASGDTLAIEIPLDNRRRAIRVTAQPQGCLRVSSAVNVNGQQLVSGSAASNDSLWRTTTLQQTGLFVLEGAASELTHISFAPVACAPSANKILPTKIKIESHLSDVPSHPGLKLRLALSSAISAESDAELLARLIGLELELDVVISAIEVIADAELIMQNQNDFTPLTETLALLPAKQEGIIDVVIGLCLQQQTSFGKQRLAGFTPRIPGGAGPADGVFVGRTNCDFAEASHGTADEIARLTAHELGHYLGLAHPVELNGSEDDLASTNTHNLMHRIPLTATATGLTNEQRERMLAHPYVIDL